MVSLVLYMRRSKQSGRAVRAARSSEGRERRQRPTSTAPDDEGDPQVKANDSGPGKLADLIAAECRKVGAITFARFMELALYHETMGYYTSGAAVDGKGGDYYTSVHTGGVFGAVLARFALAVRRHLGLGRLAVVEVGSGSGLLARDMLDALADIDRDAYSSTTYHLVERSKERLSASLARLDRHAERVRAHHALEEVGTVEGLVMAHELFDALPFHRVKMSEGGIEELYVSVDGQGGFSFTAAPPSRPELESYVASLGVELSPGQVIEICLEARPMHTLMSAALRRGFLLIVDYGSLAPSLYSPSRPEGTMRCFHRHRLDDEPFSLIGRKDITASVDFSNLIRAGEASGLETVKYTTQGQFLVDWGILDVIEALANDPGLGDVERARAVAGARTLFLPELMGSAFKVLLQAKGTATDRFYPPSPLRLDRGGVE